MLQQMRAFSKGIISSIFMGALALSFAVWGIADIFRGGSDTNVVTVGPTAIPLDQYTRDYRNFLRSESQQAGQDITAEMARKSGLADASLDRIINRTAIDNVVSDMGLTISDADVSARVRSMTVFNGPLGTFDKATFDRALQGRGFTEDTFVAGVRGDMAREQLLGPIENGFEVPRGYAHALFAYSTERRAAEYILLTPQALGPIQPPSDSVLAAYVKAHADRFSTLEYRDVTVAIIGPEDVAASVKVTDALLHNEYDAKKSTYVVPEKRDVQQISFGDEASAKAARAKIDSGSTFDQIAFAAKKTVDDRGTVGQDDLGPLGAATFALPEGDVTQPLKNFSSWVLLHVTKITPGKSTSFDEAKPELTKSLTDQLVHAKLDEASNAYGDAANSGDDVPQAAQKAGMHVIRIRAVDAKGMTPQGTRAALPADPELLAQIFSSEVGESGDAFQTKTSHVYVVSVEGVTPPKPKSLDAVRAEATRSWTAEQSTKLLEQRAAALAAQAGRDGDLRAVAQKLEAPVLFGPGLERDRPTDAFSAPLVAKLFQVPPHGVVYGPTAHHDGFIVARVTGVEHPPLPEASPGFQRGIRALAGQIAEDITVALAQDARDRQGVKINRKLFDQAVGNGESGS
jgi:peptidyl-prolyl cis-trans isomerase D